MKRIIGIIAFIVVLMAPVLVYAAGGGGFPLEHARIDLDNKASLQRGAKLFVNYCMGCHSAEYQRYNRMARDLELTDEQVRDNLIFTGAKVGDTMEIAMEKDDAKRWFGAAPPDLSVIARSRGVDYLFTYLLTFYLDEDRPLGVNNAVFPAVGMPHVLWELQGWQKPVYHNVTDASGEPKEVIAKFEVVEPGSMTPPDFRAAMNDLVNFLAYIAEPARLQRESLGFWVLFYLVIAFVVFYLLKKEYWKDVH